ncbi:hypothetical protein EG68_07772 [Paragonimus skrjabini miyazakii]|uniref:Uncharacterized protein n=1 Tax=Paragonimus skrjabini miyazakii TaxID=59628 RepID=A0A8S9YLK1_9TREM|nr:hypothetical protein EG68_07772 [Paragonimus skrjabini miyazakii]
MDELLNGSRLFPGESTALIYLVQQMGVCGATLTQLKYDSDLNASRTIETIVKRLPPHLRFKWAEVAATTSRQNREPLFLMFVEARADTTCTSGFEANPSRKSPVKELGLTGQPKRLKHNADNQCSTFISTEVEFYMESVDLKAVLQLTWA